MNLEKLPTTLAVCRLESGVPIPSWATRGSFFSISRTEDELSVVCAQANVPEGVLTERDWYGLKVRGPLDFGLTGILSSLAAPLAKASISIFAISTFDTDYLLVKKENLERAIKALSEAGHEVYEL